MKYLLFFLPLLLLTACTEPFEVDYQTIESKLVIDAVLTDAPDGSLILLSKSVSLATPETPPAISDAVVTLTGPDGSVHTATLLDSGAYSFIGFTAGAGQSYTLSVAHDGATYTASSLLPHPLQMDSVSFEFREEAPPVLEAGYLVRVHFAPAAEGEYFRFRLFRGDTLVNTMFLYDASASNDPAGEFTFRRETVPAGSTLRIRAEAIDKQVYTYYSQLADLTGSGLTPNASSAAPANPETNLSGGALGVFAALGVSEMVAKVP